MPSIAGFSEAAAVAGLSLTFDNVRTSLTASQTDETIPATGESDTGEFIMEAVIGTGDSIDVSGDSGSAYMAQSVAILGTLMTAIGNNVPIMSIGNSTGRYRYSTDANAGTRTVHQIITTVS